ncbi:aminoglycoside phosphotransferase family protein [Allorhizocola rhizosphaerae]|uniref:aminoglycoside phosphotransferase family protein n=1 Tax=Allorhizocola rhizosphaerae TaxID=1872709 RepID=UPI000E3DFB59|nr:aminoglycoside phosphotransferase family protein [Allorhizocola rhizosphaerae]
MTGDLGLLTGPDAAGPLAAALAPVGGRLLSWRAVHVDNQPGRGCTVGYQARIGWPDGRVSEEQLAATTARAPDGALVLDDGVDRVAVWRFPHDPYLPALAAATDPGAVGRLLGEFGYGGGPPRLRTRAYRPGRRAVIEAATGRGRLYLKVVRPQKVVALHERHRLLTGCGVPAPPSLGYTVDGLLVLEALPGRTLRRSLMLGGAVPSAQQVLSVLDRLPPRLADGPPRVSWLDRAGHYAAVIGAALPQRATRVGELAAELATLDEPEPVTAVHGDLYESQLLVTGDRITGLLDVDTAGAGYRADDLACMIGHLSVLAQIDPRRAPAINRLAADWLAVFDRHTDPAVLRGRIAAVVLSLATGPHRVQEPDWPAITMARLDLAAAWLADAPVRTP